MENHLHFIDIYFILHTRLGRMHLYTINIVSFLDDETIFEGDMILTKTMRDRLINNGGLDPPGSSNSSSGVKQEATTPLWQRWKNGIVPYHIAPALRKFQCVSITTTRRRASI